MIKWLKKKFSKDKQLGACTHAADSPEQAVSVALSWLTEGKVSAYPKDGYFDIHVYEAKHPMFNGFYQIPLANFSPRDVLRMTLSEFVRRFRAGDAIGMEEKE